LLIYYLLALIPFALVGYVLWTYHRKAAEKDALSHERMALLMGETQRARLQHEAQPEAAAQSAPAAPTTQPKIVTGKAPPWARRERFLSKSEAAVGDDVPAYEREQRQRRLAQHELTFVVCDKALHVIAALELNEYLTEIDADFKAECLKSAGIRLVHLDATALPPRDAIRTLVYDI
jgi:hypothetical protein